MSGYFGCENSRVQLPALLHLVRLGFTYIPHITLKKAGIFLTQKQTFLLESLKISSCA